MSLTTGDEPVEHDEELLRRYSEDPSRRPRHVKGFTDEGSGSPYLTGGALRFDSDGCSVHRVRILDDHSLSRDVVREPGFPRLAVFIAGTVRSLAVPVQRGGATLELRPYGATPTPWPLGRGQGPEHDVAHASITMVTELSRGAASRAADALARTARLDV